MPVVPARQTAAHMSFQRLLMLNLEANSPAGTQILVNPVRETGSKFELLYNQAHKVTINLSGRNNKRIIVAKRAVMGAWRFNVKMAVLVTGS